MSSSDPKTRPKPGPWPLAPDSAPVPPSSWAKRTGFRPKFSGETNASDSGQISLTPKPKEPEKQPDLEAGRARATPSPAPVPVPAPAPAPVQAVANDGSENVPAAAANKDRTVKKRRESDKGLSVNGNVNGNENGDGNGSGPAGQTDTNQQPQPRRVSRNEEMVVVDGMDDDGFMSRHSHMKYQLRDTPGLVPIGLYGFQHYLSMLGSLILVPLIIVPAMGGSQEDTSNVVSTVLFVSGVTTLLHTTFGSRLPLIQGPSFVFLAPALAIINSPEFQGLNGNLHDLIELQTVEEVEHCSKKWPRWLPSRSLSVSRRLADPITSKMVVLGGGSMKNSDLQQTAALIGAWVAALERPALSVHVDRCVWPMATGGVARGPLLEPPPMAA